MHPRSRPGLGRVGRDPAVTGEGPVSFRLPQTVTDGVNFHSRESPTTNRRPELVLTVLNDAYARPSGATPLRVPLVPAYNACAGQPRTRPAARESLVQPALAGIRPPHHRDPGRERRAANSVGLFRYGVLPGDPGTPADEADVGFDFKLSDVRTAGTLADYSGELQPRATIRITDRRSGPAVNETGTVQDLVLPATIPCAVTPDVNTGSVCNATTSLDAITPGLVSEGARAIWALGPVEVMDGGADGDVDTVPNQVFARQGLFVP